MGPTYYYNSIASYDLNGRTPLHADMDKHILAIPGTVHRVLETVWYIHSRWDAMKVFNHIDGELSRNDRLLVIDAKDAAMRNLLAPNDAVQKAWGAVMPPMPPRPLGLGHPRGVLARR